MASNKGNVKNDNFFLIFLRYYFDLAFYKLSIIYERPRNTIRQGSQTQIHLRAH